MEKYLSIIVTGRNDDYHGGFIERIQNFLDFLSYSLIKYGLASDTEIILVEWNPIGSVPRLKDILSFYRPDLISYRIITVPNNIHRSIKATKYDSKKAADIPFLEFIGKNVGIRRSNGKFILCTNADIIFNEDLISFFAQKQLSKDHFYRIDRDQLTVDIDRSFSIEKNLKTLSEHLDEKAIKKNQICRTRMIHTKASGDFLLMSKNNFIKMKGYPEIKSDGGGIDRMSLYFAWSICDQILLDRPMMIFHQKHALRIEEYSKKYEKMLYKKNHHILSTSNGKDYVEKIIRKTTAKKRNYNLNGEKWGLSGLVLEEYGI